MRNKNNLLSWFRQRLSVIRLVGVIVSLIPLLREAVAGAADLVQLFTSFGGVLSIGIFLLIFFVTFLLSIYFPLDFLSPQDPASKQISERVSQKSRAIRRRHERDELSNYRKIVFGLMIVVSAQAVGLTVLLIWNNNTINYDEVVSSLIEQSELKEKLAGRQLYMPIVPDQGSTIESWEIFDPNKYKVGDHWGEYPINDNAVGSIAIDPDDSQNLVYQNYFGYNRNYKLQASGRGPGSSVVMQYRIKLLRVNLEELPEAIVNFLTIPSYNSNVIEPKETSEEVNDEGKLPDEAMDKLFDGEWHTITVVATDSLGEWSIDGEKIYTEFNDNPVSGLPNAFTFTLRSEAYYRSILDDILIWVNI